MNRLTFFALTHDFNTAHVKPTEWLRLIDLNQLGLSEPYCDPQLAESRFWFSDVATRTDSEYVGFGSARWNDKWCVKGGRQTKLEDISAVCSPRLSEHSILAIWLIGPGWDKLSSSYHHGMQPYLDELAQVTGMNYNHTSFWANSFICHKQIFIRFQEYFKQTFKHFYDKYQFNYDYYVAPGCEQRRAAFFFERVSMLFFANNGLDIQWIP